MKKTVIFVFLLWSAMAWGQKTVRYFANADQTIITPPVGTEMVEPRGTLATAVHDELFARALVLSDRKTEIAIITLDLIGLDFSLVHQIKYAVFAATGIPPERLLLSCSHTHNAPITVELGPSMSNRNRIWESRMINNVTELVVRTRERLEPVTITSGKKTAKIGLNRRASQFYRAKMISNPAGPMAEETCILNVQNDIGTPLAILFNYPAHPVAVHRTSTELSADYPGFAVSALQNEFGQHTIPLFAQACGGNVNVEPLQGGYEKAREAGLTLATAVIKAVTEPDTLKPAYIEVINRQINLPFHKVSNEIAYAMQSRLHESMKIMKENGANEAQLQDQQDLINWAQKLHHMSKDPEMSKGIPFNIQAFALSKDFAILAMTHEVFVEYQLAIEQDSPFKYTMVLAYSNGCASYVPTAEAFFFGGYEVFGAQQRYTMPYLKPESEGLIKNACNKLLNELYHKI